MKRVKTVPPTLGFEGRCSIQLSYRRKKPSNYPDPISKSIIAACRKRLKAAGVPEKDLRWVFGARS